MSVLSLHNASILYSNGLGGTPSPQTRFRAELSDDATFSIYKHGFFGEQKALTFSLMMLSFQVWTDTVESGGGFIGGGFGVTGAAEGMLAAAVLNMLTRKRQEYSLLGLFVFPGDGSQRQLVLGFRDITESQLRERLATAIPKWADLHVKLFLRILSTHKITNQDANAAYIQLEQAAPRGLVSADQIEQMWSALARVVPPPKKIKPSNEKLESPNTDRIAMLEALDKLRISGALTQEEFDAEKARILSKG
jgi:hypothetical protein